MLFARVFRAAMLDQRLYEQLRQDPIAYVQGIAVVLLAVIATIVGAGLESQVSGSKTFGSAVGQGLGIMPGLWMLQAGSAFVLGIMGVPAEQRKQVSGHLLGAIGFSAAPGIFLVLIFVPGAGQAIGPLVIFWMLIATIVAVRASLSFSFYRAILVVVPGFLLRILVVALVTGPPSET
ncbi:MAG: hypothetical protein V3V35_03755 [Dehalococcoidia bacterium]